MTEADDLDSFNYWKENQMGDDPKAQKLYEFHSYIREDGLDTGTRLGYRRKLSDELDEDGYLEDYDKAVSEDSDSALKKYREFLENGDTDNLTEDTWGGMLE